MSSLIQTRFNGGEVSEEAWSLADIAQVDRSVRSGLNGTFIVQGGWQRSKGTWFAGLAKAGAGDFLLVPFVRAADQAVMLELGFAGGAGYGRVYGLDRARVAGVDFATPFTLDELIDGLTYVQSGDALLIYRRNNKWPQVIKRLGPTNWVCSDYEVKNGPLLPEWQSDGPGITFTSTGLSSANTIFKAGMVGSLIRVKSPGGRSQADGWRSEWDPVDNEICYYAGNYYKTDVNGSKKTGYFPPVHTQGDRLDANGGAVYGVNWTYLHDGSTFGLITGTAPDEHTASVTWLGTLCANIGETTGHWSEAAYSDYRGWPSMAPCFREERLVTGCTLNNPDVLDMTRTKGWSINSADYKPGMGSGAVMADDAIRLTIGGKGARLQWAIDREALFVGTTDALFIVTGGTYDAPIKPDSYLVREIEGGASSEAMPVKTPKTVLYVPRSKIGLFEIAGSSGEYEVDDISLLFPHLTERLVEQLAYLAAPHHLLAFRLGDGGVGYAAYQKKQNVLAASEQDFGGRVFTIARVPGSDGIDQLWIGIDRGGVRMIEVVAGPREKMFLRSAKFYQDVPEDTVTGLDHLEGKVVQALADGAWHPDLTVTAGAITLLDGRMASDIVVGLGYKSRLEFMPVGDGRESFADKQAQGLTAKVTVRGTYFEIGTTDDDNGDSRHERVTHKGANGAWVERRKTHKAPLHGVTGWDKRVFIEIEDAPFDLMVYSAKIETAQ